MTFTEAAAHVLRLVGKPLHYKEITDVAIERDLLSHVGKSPEVTMGARLAAVVKKDPKDNPLVRVKPGVFALRDWDQTVIDSGLADRTPALERLAKLGVPEEDEGPSRESAQAIATDGDDADGDGSGYPELPLLDAEEDEDIGDDERARAELAAAATELFVSEDDDDEPILGGDLETESVERGGSTDAGGKRRRRRRRRGGRSGPEEDNGLPSYTVSDAPLLADVGEDGLAVAAAPATDSPRGAESRNGESRGRPERGDRGAEGRSAEHRTLERLGEMRPMEPRNGEVRADRPRGDGRNDRSEGRGERTRGDRNNDARERSNEGRERSSNEGRERNSNEGRERNDARDRGEGREDRNGDARGDRNDERAGDVRGPDVGRGGEDLSGPSMLNLLEQLLPARSRAGAVPVRQLAEQGLRRVRGKVELQTLQDAMADAVRAEVVRARSERRRPRYAIHGRAISATDWGMDGDVLRLEKELFAAAARHREAFQKSFGERLQSLPQRALGDLFTLLLSQIGFEEVQVVRRSGGAPNQELHFSAIARAPSGDRATAIILRRDGRDIGRERVIDLRGALHHYAGAQAGFLATTGQVLSGAREEAAVPNAAPVTLLDGVGIAKLCSQHGAGVAWSELRVPMVDLDLMESLTAN